RPGSLYRFWSQGGRTEQSQDGRDFLRARAGGLVEVRSDPGIRWAPASACHPRRSRRAGAQTDSGRTEERIGQTVPAAVRDGERRPNLRRRGTRGNLQESDRTQDRSPRPAVDYGDHLARYYVRSAEP